MTSLGSPPVVRLALDADSYRPGALAVVTATITDADDTSETLTGVDTMGRSVVETIVRTDRADVLWRWRDGATVASGVNPVTLLVPTSTMTLECVVSDAEGNQTVTSVAVPVVLPPWPQVGLCCPPSQRDTHASLFPGARWYSAYGPPGSGIPSWRSLRTVPQGVTPWVRFKDTPTPGMINPWLDAMPDSVPDVILTHHHEPKVTDDPADFCDNWRALRALVDGHPNGRKVRLVVILMLWQVESAGMDWRAYWPLMPDGSAAAHAIGVDTYSFTADAYRAPESLLAVPLAIRDALGLDLYVPEYGAVRIDSDADGTGRADWISRSVACMREVGVTGVAWFCSPGNGARDYHLDNCPPELAAWRAVLAEAAAS